MLRTQAVFYNMVDGLFFAELHVGSSPANVVEESHVYMCTCVRASVTESD